MKSQQHHDFSEVANYSFCKITLTYKLLKLKFSPTTQRFHQTYHKFKYTLNELNITPKFNINSDTFPPTIILPLIFNYKI